MHHPVGGGGNSNGGGGMPKYDIGGGMPPSLNPYSKPDHKFELGHPMAVPKYELEMQKFDLSSGVGGGGGMNSGGGGSCMPKFEPKFEAKYEPNLSMQPAAAQQTSPISLTTGGQGQHNN